MKILANDGIASDGKKLLEEAGFQVFTDKIAQEDLASKITDYDVLIVRSATKVNRDILQAGQGSLKLVVRAGVGVDNIDIAAAKEFSIDVANTPLSASLSVAELVFAHIFTLSRFLHRSQSQLNGSKENFNQLKKEFSDGFELRGKTLGLLGFGRIGQETAKIAIGLGMKVVYFDPFLEKVKLRFEHLPFDPTPIVELSSLTQNEVLAQADILSLHIPFNKGVEAPINKNTIALMKKGAIIINCARGGVVDENALLEALSTKHIAYAGLDVFEEEPIIRNELLGHSQLSITPHIGASTIEAQARIGKEVAETVIHKLKLINTPA